MRVLAWGNPDLPLLIVMILGFVLGYVAGAKWWGG